MTGVRPPSWPPRTVRQWLVPARSGCVSAGHGRNHGAGHGRTGHDRGQTPVMAGRDVAVRDGWRSARDFDEAALAGLPERDRARPDGEDRVVASDARAVAGPEP